MHHFGRMPRVEDQSVVVFVEKNGYKPQRRAES